MLQRIPVKVNTPEWLDLKSNYIGCSDIPVLTGATTSYSSPLKIFEQKIGLSVSDNEMKELPYMGHIQEPLILTIWEYYEHGDREKWVQNHMNGRRIRNLEKNTGYILVNPDVPFMSLTPDGIIPQGQPTLHGEVLEKDSPVNAKNINSIKWHQWEGYIPENHLQMHGEMLVLGSQYSELAYLVGGSEFHVVQSEFDEDISKKIYNICSSFWYDRILPAKPLAARYKLATRKAEKEALMKDIRALEPMPDDTDSYRSIMSERFKNREDTDKQLRATPEMDKLMEYYQFYSDIGKELEGIKRKIKNTLLRYHEHNGANIILGETGKSTMNKKHMVSGKELPPETIKQQLNKLITL